ncbi:hypothetical protein M378DRAFT_26471 [Amanita muscaria Koide BX008]|uniref:Uncharacterized protein n=1 Tax=Amanita muscaria (strain Koide BX008) TaxID=946122 RepID=A0A0C2WUR0_AMAMK|nr:hypothetical protein M378DRAFT_26471 [Amanita muscaria Koide BX008]
MALDALVSTRRAGEPLTLLMETYNEVLSLIPTIRTYTLLVQALTDRDFEVQQVIRTIQTRIQRRTSVDKDEDWLEQQHGSRNDPLAQGQFSEVVRPDMIEFLASRGMIDNLNDTFEWMLTDGAKDGIAPTVTQRVISFAAYAGPRLFRCGTEVVEKVMIDVGKRSAMVWEESLSHGLVDLGAKVMLDYAEILIILYGTSAVPRIGKLYTQPNCLPRFGCYDARTHGTLSGMASLAKALPMVYPVKWAKEKAKDDPQGRTDFEVEEFVRRVSVMRNQ